MRTILHKSIATAVVFAIIENMLHPALAVSEFATYANVLAGAGIISMKPTESEYRLHDRISRAEMVKIAMRLAGSGSVDCLGNMYSDVTPLLGDLCGYIESAADRGIVSKAYSYFRFADPVTRAELVKMLLMAADIPPSAVSAGFLDVSPIVGDLSLFINAGVADGCIQKGDFFRPNAPASRWEVFKLTACMMQSKKSPDTAYNGTLAWSDEFTGSSLDPEKWNLETGSGGWGNNELQNYTDMGNVSVSSGYLTIEARREDAGGALYSSARINTHTKASWTHGKIEARIKLPTGQGIWPAFWMLGENIDTVDYPASGEIDIVEMVGGNSPDDGSDNEKAIWGTLHRPDNAISPPESVKSISSGFVSPRSAKWSDDFHVYGIEWDEKTVKHTVDGQIYQIADISSDTDGFDVFHKPFYVILNVAVGGDWPGSPDGTTIFPQKMLVDWVRVYQK